MLISEAEIREKVITPWLESVGIEPGSVSMELSFNIKLGRGTFTVASTNQTAKASGRADYLIKGLNNKNLFIIEAKAYGLALTEEDRDQAISYARLLKEGNIAPFAIVTNGDETRIYDTISKEILSDISEFQNHAHLKNNFIVNCDIEAQAEALQYLISLNSDTLLWFCKNQVEYRMRILKSYDLFSGKKYIPQLYISRKESSERLKELLFDEKEPQQIVIISGPPQHGKTSFLCNTVENYLDEGIPCLFYPAIGLKSGLLLEIQEDFQWNFNNNLSINLIINRLRLILSKSSQRLILFIDGLNEIDRTKALEISHECERIIPTLKIVFSATSNSLERILFENDNPNIFAEKAKINRSDTKILKTKHLLNLKDKNLIQILNFEDVERNNAINIYADAYQVIVNKKDTALNNPFYLRISMEKYAGSRLPNKIITKDLISASLKRKAARAGIDELKLKLIIVELCRVLYELDNPITNFAELNIDYPTLQKLLETAIIAEVHDENEIRGLDFYYSWERDYAIAYELRKWQNKFLLESNIILDELNKAVLTNVGKEALRWFFSSHLHIQHLKNCFYKAKSFKFFDELILYSILNQNFDKPEDLEWLRYALYDLFRNEDDSTLRPAILIKIIKALKINPNNITNNQIFLIKTLLIEESYSEDDYEIDLSESFSFELMTNYGLTNIYVNFLLDENVTLSKMSALLLASEYDTTLVDSLSNLIIKKNSKFLENHLNFIDALNFIENRETQNDSYCPNVLDNLSSLEGAVVAYLDYYNFMVVANFYKKYNEFLYFSNLIEEIRIKIKEFAKDSEQFDDLDDEYKVLIINIFGGKDFFNDNIYFDKHPYQLYIPFNKDFSELNKVIINKFFEEIR